MVRKVRPADFDEWRRLRGIQVELSTVDDESVVVKQLFKWARSRKLIVENQLADIKLFNAPSERKVGRVLGVPLDFGTVQNSYRHGLADI